MNSQAQLSIELPHRVDRARSLWLGLKLDHRQLFDALQDEWLRPPNESSGRVLAVTAFAEQVHGSVLPHQIDAHLQLDPRRLPHIQIMVKRLGRWIEASLEEVSSSDEAVFWPGAIPTFSISRIVVSTREEQARLSGLARQVSNVALPDVPLEVGTAMSVAIATHDLPDQAGHGVEVPEALDPARGAMAMALWAVPRSDPWLDVLVASLAEDSIGLERAASTVRAPWLRWPAWKPWAASDTPLAAGPDTYEEALWIASTIELSQRDAADNGSIDIVNRIAARAGRLSRLPEDRFEGWIKSMMSILRADEPVRLNEWKSSPVGKALQLVLLRPQPERFATWCESAPELAPAVWWSGAILCGLLHGYKTLPVRFRGEPAQRQLLALNVLRVGSTLDVRHLWPSAPAGPITWRRQSGVFIVSCDGVEIVRRSEHARAQWYAADLDTPEVRAAAEDLARRSGWPCFEQRLSLSDTEVELLGEGAADLSSDLRRLEVRGTIHLKLPASVRLQQVLALDLFRRCVATESGEVPTPPFAAPARATFRRSESEPLIPARPAPVHDERPRRIAHPRVRGLIYQPEFLSEAEERELVETIDQAVWRDDLKRRVQHYGWRYDYRARQIDESMHLGPLPRWAEQLARRLHEEGLLPHVADQVIVNEYCEKQGISKHIDCEPCFADGIATISLMEPWEMIFVKAPEKEPLLLERRSVAVLSEDARYAWTHEIPGRMKEPSGLRRGRRISITFRKVLPRVPG